MKNKFKTKDGGTPKSAGHPAVATFASGGEWQFRSIESFCCGFVEIRFKRAYVPRIIVTKNVHSTSSFRWFLRLYVLKVILPLKATVLSSTAMFCRGVKSAKHFSCKLLKKFLHFARSSYRNCCRFRSIHIQHPVNLQETLSRKNFPMEWTMFCPLPGEIIFDIALWCQGVEIRITPM